jgi:hypothetical protein
MADYRRARDEQAPPVYEFTCDFAKLEPPPPEMQQLMGAMQGNQQAMDSFVSVMAGTLPAPWFFGPENAGRIIAQAASPPGSIGASRPPTSTWGKCARSCPASDSTTSGRRT